MPKDDAIEMDGTVVDALPNTQFKVKLDNGHELLAYTGGKMRKFRIRILLGDRVRVEMSPYDLTRGRISYRCRAPWTNGSGVGEPAAASRLDTQLTRSNRWSVTSHVFPDANGRPSRASWQPAALPACLAI